jgi:hypothetical protein
MAIITNISGGLGTFLSNISLDIGKPIIVKSCKGIGGFEHGYSTPQLADVLEQLPAYISAHSKVVDKKSILTEFGETLVAHEATHYQTDHEGYGQARMSLISINAERSRIPDKAIGFIGRMGVTFPASIFNFLSHLKINNIMSLAGIDPIGQYIMMAEMTIKTLHENNEAYNETDLLELGVNTNKEPEAARIILFHDILAIAERYLFLPETERTRFADSLGGFWRERMFTFLESLNNINKPLAYLLSPEFGTSFTPAEYYKTEEQIHTYLRGAGGFYNAYALTEEESCEAQISKAIQMIERGDLLNAYNELFPFSTPAANTLKEKVMAAMLDHARKKGNARNTLAQVNYICAIFMKAGMTDTALAFHDEVMGVKSEIDFTSVKGIIV